MGKVAAIALLLVAIAASASAYTTVVTTKVAEEMIPQPKGPQGQSCSMEMQEKMPMEKCMMWMQKKLRGPPYSFLRSAVANANFKGLQKCCSEIEQFSPGCRCDAVKVLKDVMPYADAEKVEEMVRSLPSVCDIFGCQI